MRSRGNSADRVGFEKRVREGTQLLEREADAGCKYEYPAFQTLDSGAKRGRADGSVIPYGQGVCVGIGW